MAADDTPTEIPRTLEAELQQSRESAAKLMDTLARKIGVKRAKDYVHSHSPRDFAAGMERAVRRRPLYVVLAAVAVGFLMGCALRKGPSLIGRKRLNGMHE